MSSEQQQLASSVAGAEDVREAAQGSMHSTQAVESPMASSRPWDMRQARKWNPDVDPTDFTTIFPQHDSIVSQEVLLERANQELTEFLAKTEKSRQMQEAGKKNMPWGVFGSYQKDWETPHLFFADKCMGARLWDVDGNEYVDFNFGDTPAMFGHGPENPAIKAAAERMLSGRDRPDDGNARAARRNGTARRPLRAAAVDARADGE